jgi:hypothetical protein
MTSIKLSLQKRKSREDRLAKAEADALAKAEADTDGEDVVNCYNFELQYLQ